MVRDWSLIFVDLAKKKTPSADDVLYQLSPRYENKEFKSIFYNALLRHINLSFPQSNVRSHIATHTTGSIPLAASGTFHDYVIIRGSCFQASCRSANARNSMVEVVVDNRGSTAVGELTDIIVFDQPPLEKISTGVVKWLVPLNADTHLTLWQKL